jgi:hypothetical protein
MYAQVEKPKENRSRAAANSACQNTPTQFYMSKKYNLKRNLYDVIQRYPLYNPTNTKQVTVQLDKEYKVYYEENITPNMYKTGQAYNHQYDDKPKTMVYVPEIILNQGKIKKFRELVDGKLNVKAWYVNDPLHPGYNDEKLLTTKNGKIVRTKTKAGAWIRLFGARRLIKDWVKEHSLNDIVHHKELLEDETKFINSMTLTGDGVPNTSGEQIEEAESNETTGAVSFNKSVITTGLAVHEFVHTFFQKPNTGNMQAYEPIVEFIALQILGINERVSPAGGFPYGTNLQGEKSTGGLPSKVSRAIKYFRGDGQKEFSLTDLAVRWARFLSTGEANKALNELSGYF